MCCRHSRLQPAQHATGNIKFYYHTVHRPPGNNSALGHIRGQNILLPLRAAQVSTIYYFILQANLAQITAR